MTNEYELADDNRRLIYKKQLLARLLPGMEQPPHPMLPGDDEGDYYRGHQAPPGTPDDGRRRAPARVIAFWILGRLVLGALGIVMKKSVHSALSLAGR